MSLTIKQNLVSKEKYSIKCPYSMNAEFLVCHNTANDASAENEVKYMITNDNQVSFHYAVDDKEAVQGLPLNRNAWAAGDGANGQGNRKGIHIEICYSKSGGIKFQNAEKNAAKLMAQLLHERGWGVEKVKKHQDFSGKYCPHRTLDIGWASFINLVKDELKALKVPTCSPESNNTDVWYRVIVGSYQNRTTAENVKTRLTAEGVAGVWIDVFKDKNKVKWYRVIAGSYNSKANAEKVKKDLDQRYNGVWIAIA